MNNTVILSSEIGEPIGIMEKLQGHKLGLKHLAFSLFVINENKMLIQQRAFEKYHGGGLWSNACCSHPWLENTLEQCVVKKTKQEFGFDLDASKLISHGVFSYCELVNNDLTENEYDYLFTVDMKIDEINPNPAEIASFRWVQKEDLLKEINDNPNNFTVWFRQIMEKNLIEWS